MNSRRNVYDGLNANRTRRGSSALDDLERTLNGLEAKIGSLGSRQEPGSPRLRDDAAERFHQLAQQIPSREPAYAAREERYATPQTSSHARPAPQSGSLSKLANDIERARREEEGFADLSNVSAEINRLRDDIRALSERPADRSGEVLRREIEELKRSIGLLAREDTLRSVESRWDSFDRRSLESDPAFEKLAGRLEEIQNAVDGLPQSLSLQSLEEKVRVLATALDSLSRQNPNASTEHLELIESRLDEISRAIIASSVSIQPVNIDKTPFDRIEARLSSLATRIEEIAENEPAQELTLHLADRMAMLGERLDELSRASSLPEEQIGRLAAQMEAIAHKIAVVPEAMNPDAMMQGLENRLYEIASAIDRKSRDATDQTLTYFRDLEGRLQELTVRLEESEKNPSAKSPEVMKLINERFADFHQKFDEKQRSATEPVGLMARGLETRLDEITRRLDTTAAAIPALDPGIISHLEAQVLNLSKQLDFPSIMQSPSDDIAPRLAAIEHSITANREALLDAARRAAEDALRNMALPQAGANVDREAVIDLAQDLKSLEAMARKADDRNSRTFEAIHDTLLKIVDRLTAIELDEPVSADAAAKPKRTAAITQATEETLERVVDLGRSVPTLEPEESSLTAELRPQMRSVTRSPAEAAVAAAAAAASAANGSRATDTPAVAGKTSIFAELARKVRGTPKADVVLAGDPMPQEPANLPIEPKFANQPLEPGSGAPDLNSIMKRVREERQSRTDGNPDSVVKSDLIAAARRAAQAAAAEAEILKKASGKVDPSSKSGVADLLNRQRKPILMAIGAVILALSGLQLGKAFLLDDSASTQAKAPIAVEEAAPIASKSADVSTPAPAATASSTAGSAPDVRKVDSASDAMLAPAENMDTLPKSLEKPMPTSGGEPGNAMPALTDKSVTESGATKAPEIDAAPLASAEKPVANDTVDTAKMPPVDAGPIALREAAASGDPKAVFEIGSRYAEGRGVAKDLKEAAKYYTDAADAGFAPAQFRIGNFFEKGIGVERDATKAKTWYQMAAEQGNASAMHNLAVLFAMGAAGPADNESAARWFTKAAEFGIKDSQYNLGILAAKGLGLKQDLEESYKWFALAAKTGDKDAASKRDDIANAMRPEQLAKARAAADLWKPKAVEPSANATDVPESWKESAGQTASVGETVDMKKAIRNIQLILAKNGYDVGTPDGVMGGKTKSAISAYQASNGMKATGEVDEELVRSLLAKAK
jgi:localization factor PodJL